MDTFSGTKRINFTPNFQGWKSHENLYLKYNQKINNLSTVIILKTPTNAVHMLEFFLYILKIALHFSKISKTNLIWQKRQSFETFHAGHFFHLKVLNCSNFVQTFNSEKENLGNWFFVGVQYIGIHWGVKIIPHFWCFLLTSIYHTVLYV